MATNNALLDDIFERLTNGIKIISDGIAGHIRGDANSEALQMITVDHHKAHEGDSYFVIHSEQVDNAGDVEVRFAAPFSSKRIHMVINVKSALAATVSMWTDTTKTHEAGNAITPLNRDFNSTNVSALAVCHTPGGSQAGDADLVEYIGAANVSGKVNEGGGADSRHEFILKEGEAYYIKAVSRADSNAISIVLDFYEHEAYS